MSEAKKQIEYVNGPGLKPTKEQMLSDEHKYRGDRDVALNDYRRGKVFGSYNSEVAHISDLCRDADANFDMTYAVNKDYLEKLKTAQKNGQPLDSVKEPTLAIGDNKTVAKAKKYAKKGAYYLAKGISYINPIGLVTGVAGDLWDKDEFAKVKDLISATETQRERIMADLDYDIRNVGKQLKSKEEAHSDRKAEAVARQRDEDAAREIRRKLGSANPEND